MHLPNHFLNKLLGLAICSLALQASVSHAQDTKAASLPAARVAADTSSTARFALGLSRNNGQSFDTAILTTDSIRLIGTIEPEAAQLGKPAQIFVVAQTGGRYFMRSAGGNFVPWDGNVASLLPYRSNEVLTAQHPVDFLTGSIPIAGRFNLFLGYKGSDNVLVYSRVPHSIVVLAAGGQPGGGGGGSGSSVATEPPSRANGYTGIVGDVLQLQQFDCEARSEHEWYRTDRTLVIDHQNPDILYVSVEHRGIFKSIDGGKTWQLKSKGIKAYARKDDPSKGCYGEYPVIKMNPLDSQHLVAGLSGPGGGFLHPTLPNSQVGGVYQSFNGGESWQLMITDSMNVYVNDVAFDPVNPDTIYYSTGSLPASWGGADQNKIYVEKGLIYKTSDRGQSWVELPTGIGQNTSVSAVLINPQQTGEINAPTYSATRLSSDGTGTGVSTGKDTTVQQLGVLTTVNGSAWQSRKPVDNPPLLKGFASKNNWQFQYFVPSQTGSSGEPKGLFTADAGRTFTQTSYMDIVAYDPFDSTGAHAIGYSTILWRPSDPFYTLYESFDGGKTWQPLGRLPAEIPNPNDSRTRPSNLQWGPQNNRTLYMNGASGLVWKSSDLGSTWTKLLDYRQL